MCVFTGLIFGSELIPYHYLSSCSCCWGDALKKLRLLCFKLMKFGRIVLQVNTNWLTEWDFCRVRTILALGNWVLGNICRYWVVLLLGDVFFHCDTQYDTDQTAVSTVHMITI